MIIPFFSSIVEVTDSKVPKELVIICFDTMKDSKRKSERIMKRVFRHDYKNDMYLPLIKPTVYIHNDIYRAM